MKSKIHAAAGGIAMLTIAAFWTSTAISELFGSPAQIAQVKQAIVWGLLILVPAIAAVGGSGFALGGKWKGPLIVAKKRRMKIIAANGVLILVPAAFYLNMKAQAFGFDPAFYAVQAVELVAGAVNLALLGLNMRDGLRMTLRRRLAAH
ncbi:MAG: hypothetical protein RIB53_15240 [Roseitalea porphyridii]|uniref:hypothetical protein n=1 Tax=Roseitalea porphyridii TaxID=1852022 RepID=UPI0032EAA3B1